MSIRHRFTAGVTAVVMSGAMAFGTAQAATAAPTTSVAAPAATTSLTSAPLLSTSTPAPLPAPTAQSGGQVTPAAVPIAVRVAVRAALEVLKRTNKAWYNNIVTWVGKGRTAFIKFWNEQVPGWVKDIFGGISAAVIYDAIKWVLGL